MAAAATIAAIFALSNLDRLPVTTSPRAGTVGLPPTIVTAGSVRDQLGMGRLVAAAGQAAS
jgi:hypothetical protein